MLRQSRRAKHAVTFAAKKFWRQPALMPRGPEPDEITNGFHVWRLSEKLVGLFVLGRTAVAGGDRINEHHVRSGQNGILIVVETERRLGLRAVVIHLHA